MRLTLRTLLAYLDDVLDPADKEELSKKIESSEFAEDLVHRTRDTVRRLRLSAPQVIGSGMGLDPNTVAEYLDNVLPPESVGDFERICLESDMHLAEAAACHHILTMVLGEPADVDPTVRQRMYTIATEADGRRHVRIEPAHMSVPANVAIATEPAVAQPVKVMATLAGVVEEPSGVTEVPDYLRASGWSAARWALVGLAAVVIGAVTWFLVMGTPAWLGGQTDKTALAGDASDEAVREQAATGRLEPAPVGEPDLVEPDATAPFATDQPITTNPNAIEPAPPIVEAPAAIETQNATTDAAVAEPPDRYAVPATQQTEAATTQETALGSAPQETGQPVTSSDIIANAAPPLTADEAAQMELNSTEPNGVPPITSDVPPQTADASQSEELTAASDAPQTASLPTTPSDVVDTADPSSEIKVIGAAPTADAMPNDAAPADSTIASANVTPETQAITTPQEPAGPPELGTYLGGKTVLLRYNPQAGGWYRVEPRQAVMAGDRLLALPEFRPKITLISGVHMDISGGSQVILRPAEEVPAEGLPEANANVPIVEVVYGRVILINTSNAENRVRLVAGSNVADAVLGRNATLGVSVERQFIPGQDPQQSASPVVARLYAPDGGVEWQDKHGTQVAENASQWTLAADEPSQIVADASPPDWIDQEPVGQLSEQRYGAPVIDNTLTSDRPADIQLLELFQGNARKEVKSLAAKSSIHVGLFEPFIEALRDSDQKANWRTHIETLRSAMAQSAESAAAVSQALVEQRGRQAAADLYEMLRGYSAEQVGRTPDEIRSGAVARLIDWLEKDSLDYRVLAVHNLWEITGKRLMPDPTANLNERNQNVRRWRARLESGDLRPVERQ